MHSFAYLLLKQEPVKASSSNPVQMVLVRFRYVPVLCETQYDNSTIGQKKHSKLHIKNINKLLSLRESTREGKEEKTKQHKKSSSAAKGLKASFPVGPGTKHNVYSLLKYTVYPIKTGCPVALLYSVCVKICVLSLRFCGISTSSAEAFDS